MRVGWALLGISLGQGMKPIEVFIDRVSSSAAAEKSEKSTPCAERHAGRARRREPIPSEGAIPRATSRAYCIGTG